LKARETILDHRGTSSGEGEEGTSKKKNESICGGEKERSRKRKGLKLNLDKRLRPVQKKGKKQRRLERPGEEKDQLRRKVAAEKS